MTDATDVSLMSPATNNHESLIPEIVLDSKDNIPPRNLSRSPHPYHRRSSSLKTPQNGLDQLRTRYIESSDTTESEERATEADDEKGPILKGLPAPPLRGRKGLKGSKTPQDLTPAISPFPTPPAFTDKRSSYFATYTVRKKSQVQSHAQQRDEEAYKRYIRRRRAEISRRCTEVVLLAFIGIVACAQSFSSGLFGILSSELYASIIGLFSLYTLFPIRLCLRNFRSGYGLSSAIKLGFHVPSVFDPGSLLYPVFLPFFISTSLYSTRPVVVLANVILGLSSVPPKVMFFTSSTWHALFLWIFSTIPLIFGTSDWITATSSVPSSSGIGVERLVLLCPLHQATLLTLKYLTSTSLDLAEIELLSAGLVNLCLFATSPQAEILKALLWVGALCLFIFCQKPLSWEVSLARVPSWKFARNKSPGSGLLGALENMFNFILPRNHYAQHRDLDSDDEDYEHLRSARRRVKNQLRLRKTRTSGLQSDLEPILSEKDVQVNGNGLQRAQTLSVTSGLQSPLMRRRKNSLPRPTTGILSLTYMQAQACKWLISAYVFSAVLFIVLVVVRYYVSVQALSSHEPFGWAVGYLLGDIQSLRLWVVTNNMNTWVALPVHKTNNAVTTGLGWMEYIRQTHLGPATMRLVIASYCVAILTIGIGAVLRLKAIVEVDTRRKVFHGIMVAMLLPTIFIDPCFIALALSLILAIFLLLDLFRGSQMPPISKPLTTFLAPYVDGRDYRGPIIVSPIFLLVGCAIPLWLSLSGADRIGSGPWRGWDTSNRELSMISGVVCVGMGDAAASLIGRRYGRTKWVWGGGKSIEGSFAFALAVVTGLAAAYLWLRIGGWVRWEPQALPAALLKMALAGSGASILESVLTAGNDNVIVPIGLWLMTRGLGI